MGTPPRTSALGTCALRGSFLRKVVRRAKVKDRPRYRDCFPFQALMLLPLSLCSSRSHGWVPLLSPAVPPRHCGVCPSCRSALGLLVLSAAPSLRRHALRSASSCSLFAAQPSARPGTPEARSQCCWMDEWCLPRCPSGQVHFSQYIPETHQPVLIFLLLSRCLPLPPPFPVPPGGRGPSHVTCVPKHRCSKRVC